MAKANKKKKAERGRPIEEGSKRSLVKEGKYAKVCLLIPTELRDKLKVEAASDAESDMSDIVIKLLKTRYE